MSGSKHPTPESSDSPSSSMPISRRSFLGNLAGAGVAAKTITLFPARANAAEGSVVESVSALSSSAGTESVSVTVNGRPYQLRIEPRVTLLDALRENLGLFGTKKGCDHGQCGACTVLVNGRRINSLSYLRNHAPRGSNHHRRGPRKKRPAPSCPGRLPRA
jgi:xanthine dehydrogenase YagT iron-sulfur-binding subunit